MDTNKIFQDIGEFGWYQFMICLFLAMSMVPASFSNLNVVFIMGIFDFGCYVPNLQHLNSTQDIITNVTIPLTESHGTSRYSRCYMYDRNYSSWTDDDIQVYNQFGNVDNASTVQCQNGWMYDTEVFGETATTEWDLVCDRKWWQAAAASFFSFGLLASLLIYGTLADLLGRKPVLCAYTVLFIISNFATALSPGYLFIIATRFLCGFFAAPYYGGTLVLALELIGPKWRAHVNALFGYMWSVGGIIMALLAYAIKDWRNLQYALSSIMLIVLGYFLIPESPRWLYLKNRCDKADKIFFRIAKSNKRTFTPGNVQFEKLNDTPDQAFVWQLFSGKSITVKTLVTCWNWFATSLCYYGLTYNSTSLGSNEYLSFIISVLMEVPGMMMCHFVTVKIGRKYPLVISMIISGVTLMLTLLFKSGSIGLIVLVSLGKMFCTLAFNLLYVYMLELYPTVIRTTACNVGNFWGRIGSILAPFIAQLSDFGSSIPMVIYGLCSLLAGLLAVLLPETIGKELDDTLQQTALQQKNQEKEEYTESCIDKSTHNNRTEQPEQISNL